MGTENHYSCGTAPACAILAARHPLAHPHDPHERPVLWSHPARNIQAAPEPPGTPSPPWSFTGRPTSGRVALTASRNVSDATAVGGYQQIMAWAYEVESPAARVFRGARAEVCGSRLWREVCGSPVALLWGKYMGHPTEIQEGKFSRDTEGVSVTQCMHSVNEMPTLT